MTGSALMDFLIAVVGLCILVGLIFIALDRISPDASFKQIGRYAVGGAALLIFLVALKGVLFGGSGAMGISPVGVIEFAIGLLVVLVVIFLVFIAIDRFAPADLAVMAKYVIGALALIAILVLAERVMTGGVIFATSSFQQFRR